MDDISFNDLERKLIEFIIREESDAYSQSNRNIGKYNNLKMFMRPKKNPNAHLIVRMGISEASFNLPTGELIEGSLGSETRIIKKWLEREGICTALIEIWNAVTKLNLDEL